MLCLIYILKFVFFFLEYLFIKKLINKYNKDVKTNVNIQLLFNTLLSGWFIKKKKKKKDEDILYIIVLIII